MKVKFQFWAQSEVAAFKYQQPCQWQWLLTNGLRWQKDKSHFKSYKPRKCLTSRHKIAHLAQKSVDKHNIQTLPLYAWH